MRQLETVPGEARRLRVVSYNVHACIGNDGRYCPERVCDLLQRLQPDFVGLQELEDRRIDGELVSDYLARRLDMYAYPGSTLKREDAPYGNLLLSRQPARITRLHDISSAGREPRGVIEAEYELLDQRFRLLVTHFGLSAIERNTQAESVYRLIQQHDADLTVLLGDFNEWRLWSYPLRTLKRSFGSVARCRSWPARWPVLALDGICISPGSAVANVRAETSSPARSASDHLPLIGDIELPG
jgi:endonuclease/exonuclease/phosphatase family metal-dependent hydrolase